MKIKNTFVSLAFVVLVLAGGLPLSAFADKIIEVDMRFAGTFSTGILRVDQTGETGDSVLIHWQAKGHPGRAEIRGFGSRLEFVGFMPDCLGTPGIRIDILEDPYVFTFKDLSLLFAKNGSGQICIDVVTGEVKFVSNIMFMGGRGRFEGATGYAVIDGREGESVSSDGTFAAGIGTIVGWVIVPNDNDDDDSDSD